MFITYVSERLVNLEHWNAATSGKFFPIFGQNAAISHVYREKKELVEILTDFMKQVVAIYLTSGGESDMTCRCLSCELDVSKWRRNLDLNSLKL